MNAIRKLRAIPITPFQGIETVGDLLDFSACYAIVGALAWLLVWPA